jgi:putative PIG3 family NAD(P)H quinone oxidoreductase
MLDFMKAAIISKPGPPEVLIISDRLKPTPAANEVIIKVKAAGINRPDIIQRKGNYPAPPGVPADIPGLEVAGIIQECGASVERWKPGDTVCALISGAGYAEFTVADYRHCLPIPETFTFEEAASLPETIFTVWHNVFQRGQLKEGETFLVHGGSSGIGTAAIQLAKAFGSRVFTTAGTKEKCIACEKLGAEKCVNYNQDDFELVLKEIGIDMILDMIGGDYIDKNIRILNPDGRLIFINAMMGGKIEINPKEVMRRGLTITGSTLRNRDASFKAALTAEVEKKVWPLLKNRIFRPVIHETFSFKDVVKAHQLMESSQHIGKVILRIE